MLNLIRMEWYKLRTKKLFLVLVSIVFGITLIIALLTPVVTNMFMPGITLDPLNMSDLLANPFVIGLLMIPMFISAVSFMYTDFSGGYIKNIAGQVGNRGKIVTSKFVAVGIHNLIFFVAAAAARILGAAFTGKLAVDSAIFGGVMTLLLKWLLSMALCAILMFFAVGIRNKTFASIIAVIFSINALSLLYMAIDTGIMNLFKITDFSIGSYLPDSLMGSVNAITNTDVVNSIIVSAVFIAVFFVLTYITFKKRDVK